jgi:HlyD family secretion protein
MRARTVWISTGLVAAVVAGGTWWWTSRETAPEWRTAPITRGSIEVTVTATGALQAVTTIQVGTQVSGTIAALYADFNSKVTKDQVIARLDSTLLKAALSDAQSAQERVAAQAQQALAERDRARALFARELISRSELEQAEASGRVATANLSSAKAQTERARINLRYAIIRSPIDGIVLSRAVELGQTVAASFNTPTLFTLAGDLREMRVQAAVDEADIGRLRVGQAATFTVDAYPDTVFTGTVEQVRLQPIVTQNVVTYDVILRAANPELRLMPGMTANLSIVTDGREDVLRAPAAALRFMPPQDNDEDAPGKRDTARRARFDTTGKPGSEQGGARKRGGKGTLGRIYILENGIPKAVRVKIGLTDGARTEIEGSIEPGTEVIIGIVSTGSAAAPGGAPFGMQQTRGAGGGRR